MLAYTSFYTLLRSYGRVYVLLKTLSVHRSDNRRHDVAHDA